MNRSASVEAPPPNKKSRISLACNQCRQRKHACSGERPRCMVCQHAGRTCTFDIRSRKRGLQSGYVRGLEVILGIVFHYHANDDARIQSILQNKIQNGSLFEDDESTSFVTCWRTSGVARDLDRLLGTPMRGTLADEYVERPLPLPVNAGATRSMALPGLSELEGHTEIQTEPPVQCVESRPQFSPDIYKLELPSDAADLAEFFIDSTHSWFPIFKRSDVLKSVYVKISSTMSSYERNMRLCLWAIISYVLANRAFTSPRYKSTDLQELIRAALLQAEHDLDLSHVQIILIIVLLKIANNQLEIASMLVAQASSMFLSCKEGNEVNKDKYTRVYRGCILLDAILCTLLRRRTCLPFRDLTAADNSLNDDSIDEWQLWSPIEPGASSNISSTQKQPLRALSIFSSTSELALQLCGLLDRKHSRASLPKIIQDLDTWKVHLPPHCKTWGRTVCSQPLFLLNMMWYFTLCSLFDQIDSTDAFIFHRLIDSVNVLKMLLNQYIEETRSMEYSPLLVCFIKQLAQSKMKLSEVYGQASNLHNPHDETSQSNLQVILDTWQTAPMNDINRDQTDSTSIATHSQGTGFEDHMYTAAGDPATTEPVGANLNRTTPLLMDVATGPHGDVIATDWANLEVVQGNADGSDGFFEGMSPVLPTRRPEHATVFSQNLGFLGGTTDFEWLEIIQNTGFK